VPAVSQAVPVPGAEGGGVLRLLRPPVPGLQGLGAAHAPLTVALPRATLSLDKMDTPRARRRVVAAPSARRPPPELQSLSVVVEDDQDTDTSYLDQEGYEERRRDYERGIFHFVGVWVEAEVLIQGTVQTLVSPGLWGIESDSGEEYIEGVAVEEYSELRKILTTVGVPTAQLPQPTSESVREMEWRQ
jgi:hypothetical protein